MKNKSYLIVLSLALLSVATLARAEEKRNAVNLFGNITSSSDQSNVNVNLGYERLIMDKLSVSVGYSQFYSSPKVGNDSGLVGLTGGVTYYIGQPLQGGRLLFYVKGAISALRFASGGTTTSGTGLGAFAGMEQPISESTSLFEELGGQRNDFDGNKDNQVVFNVGLKLRF